MATVFSVLSWHVEHFGALDPEKRVPEKPIDPIIDLIAAQPMKFRSFGGSRVDVRGWPQLESAAERDAWAKRYSDHAMLYFEVESD